MLIYIGTVIIVLPVALLLGALMLNRASLLAPPGTLARLAAYLGHNVAELKPDAGFPELRPSVYPVKPELLCREIPRALAMLKWDWQETHHCHYQATVTTALLRFTDDVTIAVEPVGEASSCLRIRSASRVGRADFGANRRHVLDLVDTIEQLLATGKPVTTG